MPRSAHVRVTVGNWQLYAQKFSPLREHLITHVLNVSAHLKNDPLVELAPPAGAAPYQPALCVHRSRLAVSAHALLDAVRPHPAHPAELCIVLEHAHPPRFLRVILQFLYAVDITLSTFTLQDCSQIAELAHAFGLADLSTGVLTYIRLQNLLPSAADPLQLLYLTALPPADAAFRTYFHSTALAHLAALSFPAAIAACETLLARGAHHLADAYFRHVESANLLAHPDAFTAFIPFLSRHPPPTHFRPYFWTTLAALYPHISTLFRHPAPDPPVTTKPAAPSGAPAPPTTSGSLWALLSARGLARGAITAMCANLHERDAPAMLDLLLSDVEPYESDDAALITLLRAVPLPPWHRAALFDTRRKHARSPRALRLAAVAFAAPTPASAQLALPLELAPSRVPPRAAGLVVVQAVGLTLHLSRESDDALALHLRVSSRDPRGNALDVDCARVLYSFRVTPGSCRCAHKPGGYPEISGVRVLAEFCGEVVPRVNDFEEHFPLFRADLAAEWHKQHGAQCTLMFTFQMCFAGFQRRTSLSNVQTHEPVD